VLAVAIGLLIVVAIAVSILAVVALPNLRNGSRLLTPDGERALEQARHKPVAAAGQTVRTVRTAHRVASRAWAPASERLHDLMDRLETREGAPVDLRTGEIPVRDLGLPEGAPLPDSGPPTAPVRVRHTGAAGSVEPGAPIRHAQPVAPLRQKFDVAAIVGKRGGIGRPRSVPPISGPIPVDPAPAEERVIDLRGAEGAQEHEAGSTPARHAR
jgi:hypothetical protein